MFSGGGIHKKIMSLFQHKLQNRLKYTKEIICKLYIMVHEGEEKINTQYRGRGKYKLEEKI